MVSTPRNTARLWLALLACLFTGLAQASPVLAEKTEDTSSTATALRIGSGPDGKLYQLMVRDMQSVCGSDIPLINVPSVGGIPNLMGLSASKLDLGIVQLDTLQDLSQGADENIQTLQAVMPLHMNLLHVLALRGGYRVGELKASYLPWKSDDTRELRTVRKFSDLKGLRVAVVGSTMLLGQRLNERLGYGMDLRKADSTEIAVSLLRGNMVQAIFTDGGWPLPSIADLRSDSGLALVDFDLPATPPLAVVKHSYENLDAFRMNFLASPNLLVTRPFKPGGDMGKRVLALQACLLRHMDELQEGRFQSAWREIKNPMDTLGIPRYGHAH